MTIEQKRAEVEAHDKMVMDKKESKANAEEKSVADKNKKRFGNTHECRAWHETCNIETFMDCDNMKFVIVPKDFPPIESIAVGSHSWVRMIGCGSDDDFDAEDRDIEKVAGFGASEQEAWADIEECFEQ